MASLIKYNSRKRRNRSSNSSTSLEKSSDRSPADKKSRNIQESEDEVLTALEMAEQLSENIETILAKVSKLDSISASVQKIEAVMDKLEERMSKLEGFQKSASKDIEDLKEGCNFMGGSLRAVQDQIFEANSMMHGIPEKLKESEEKIKKYEREIEDLKTNDLYLEAYSRRENVKFLNIDEDEDEDAEEVLRSFLKDELQYSEHDIVEIQRVHRNGRKVGSRPRPILARFLRYKDCQNILSLGRNLKGTNFQMFADLPYELVKRRKKLMPIYKKAKENRIPASFSKAEPDKLYVRGR